MLHIVANRKKKFFSLRSYETYFIKVRDGYLFLKQEPLISIMLSDGPVS